MHFAFSYGQAVTSDRHPQRRPIGAIFPRTVIRSPDSAPEGLISGNTNRKVAWGSVTGGPPSAYLGCLMWKESSSRGLWSG